MQTEFFHIDLGVQIGSYLNYCYILYIHTIIILTVSYNFKLP